MLRFLESREFPAERCATDEPVSTLAGQGVLVTEFVEGKQPDNSERTLRKLADLVGRLHTLPRGPRGIPRDAGALHLYTPKTRVIDEVAVATACLAVVEDRVRGSEDESAYTRLREQLAAADDFADLPTALIHIDLVRKNVVSVPGGGLVPIDWAGAGYGPRILSLAMLLFYGSLARDGWRQERVDAIAEAYAAHVSLEPAELDRLAAAMAHRPLLDDAFGFSIGVATNGKPSSRGDWESSRRLADEIAGHARRSFATT